MSVMLTAESLASLTSRLRLRSLLRCSHFKAVVILSGGEAGVRDHVSVRCC